MAKSKKTETPIQETVAEVAEKVKTARKKTTTAKGTKKATAKTTKPKQEAKKAPAKSAAPVSCKEQEKQGEKKPLLRDAKGKFIKGQSGNPKGRMAGQVNQAILEIRGMAKEDALPKLREAIRKGEKWAILAALEYGLPKIKPLSVDPEQISEKAKELLQDYQQGKRTLKETAIEMAIHGIETPPVIEILLRKEEQIPDDPTGGQYSTMSNEEMERLVAERRAKAKAQEEDVPNKRAELDKLYKEMDGKDSFAPDAMPKAKED